MRTRAEATRYEPGFKPIFWSERECFKGIIGVSGKPSAMTRAIPESLLQ
jgi:hypothetical protein